MDIEVEDLIISEFLLSTGPWSKHIVIGGGYALIIYKIYLADPSIENSPVGTRDIDSLIPRKVPEASKKNIAKHLQEAGFLQTFKDLDNPATEAYTKEINNIEVEIEFLTDSSTRKDKHKNVCIAGVVAQPLSYLTLSIDTTIPFQTHSGESGSVVSPAAWMFHKGLTFTRRKKAHKVHKDLYGIWYVSTQLEEFSKQAIQELNSLKKDHFKWFKTFKSNLCSWIENASPSDWLSLEAQDPAGNLRKQGFKYIIQELCKPIS